MGGEKVFEAERWKREESPRGLRKSRRPDHNYSLKCKVESSKNFFL
jgi:hypothetical protein